jgi:hypothetical protein
MSLKPLIKRQEIMIDDHKRGSREVKNWDDESIDIHIDKRTKTKIAGRYHEVIIKVPVNSQRNIQITSNKKGISIPNQLQKEIRNAFDDVSTREQFIFDMVKILKNFNSITSSKEKATDALKNVAKHFGLDWSDDKLNQVYREAMRNRYVKEITDVDGKIYRLSIDDERIEIEDESV